VFVGKITDVEVAKALLKHKERPMQRSSHIFKAQRGLPPQQLTQRQASTAD
jgi:hypothetical protein